VKGKLFSVVCFYKNPEKHKVSRKTFLLIYSFFPLFTFFSLSSFALVVMMKKFYF
jgi:hypothetical protein